jgi:hypothetical protein
VEYFFIIATQFVTKEQLNDLTLITKTHIFFHFVFQNNINMPCGKFFIASHVTILNHH